MRAALLGAAAGYRVHGSTPGPAYGSYKPSSSTTGPTGTYAQFPQTPVDKGNANKVVVYDTPGQIVVGEKIGYAICTTPASNPVKFYSCTFQGVVGASGHAGLLDTSGESIGSSNPTKAALCSAQAFDCLFSVQPGAAQTYLNCVYGHDWRLERCEGTGGTDILRTHNAYSSGNSNCWHYGCYLHGYTGWLVDPSQGNTPSHNDIWQQEGGGNCGSVGSFYFGVVNTTLGDGASWSGNGKGSNPAILSGLTGNSCIQLNNNTGAVPNYLLDQNWFDGGYISLNLANNGKFTSTNTITLTNNLFGHNQGAQVSGGDGTATCYCKTGTILTQSNNHYFDGDLGFITIRFN